MRSYEYIGSKSANPETILITRTLKAKRMRDNTVCMMNVVGEACLLHMYTSVFSNYVILWAQYTVYYCIMNTELLILRVKNQLHLLYSGAHTKEDKLTFIWERNDGIRNLENLIKRSEHFHVAASVQLPRIHISQ